MAIKDIVSLCAALIGSTAAVLAAWSYIRTNHPPRGELFRALMIITITIVGILGFAVFISRATTITVNGQDTVPVPGLSTPQQTAPAYFPMPTPSPSPSATSSPSVTPSPSPSVTPLASPTVTVTPSTTSTPSSTATPSSSPTVTPSATP